VTLVTWWQRMRAKARANPAAVDAWLAVAVLLLGLTGQPDPRAPDAAAPATPGVVALSVACIALVFRRRWPLPVWGVTVVASAVGIVLLSGPPPSMLATMIALYTVATRCPPRAAILCALATAGVLGTTFHVATGEAWLGDSSYTILAVSAMSAAIGIAVRGRRQVLAAAEERALRAEQTREEEAERRVTEERLRIARELHDVVAHHISVINVQSGVARHLVHSDPDAADVALGHVRDASAVVLSEMSTILGLLRTSDDDPDVQPAPGLGQADALVESVRRSGLTVSWRVTGAPRDLSPSVDLTAYRLVQEALTNAGKHGLGAADVCVDYRADVVALDVTNALAATDVETSSGHGLIGMRERVAAVGGTLVVGPRDDGRFGVHAELPLGTADVAAAYERSGA
jgi:signal transduction histidine kinase